MGHSVRQCMPMLPGGPKAPRLMSEDADYSVDGGTTVTRLRHRTDPVARSLRKRAGSFCGADGWHLVPALIGGVAGVCGCSTLKWLEPDRFRLCRLMRAQR
jgi:hypothetical protein